ncbi:hypothetical protein NIES22_29480 [Calothrix brevissima NIES-22]|nr:hypothetical protein NIES22_29480 [Calothrix brevissima NIES-22]
MAEAKKSVAVTALNKNFGVKRVTIRVANTIVQVLNTEVAALNMNCRVTKANV